MLRYEYFNPSYDVNISIYGDTWISQTFTIGTTGDNVTHNVYSIKMYVKKNGSHSGSFIISIQKVNGNNKPDGTDLCSRSISANALKSSYSWVEFILFPNIKLSLDTMYAFVCRCPSGDIDDSVRFGAKGAGGYSGGILWGSFNSGVDWENIYNYDILFEEWGVDLRNVTEKGIRIVFPEVEGYFEQVGKQVDRGIEKTIKSIGDLF